MSKLQCCIGLHGLLKLTFEHKNNANAKQTEKLKSDRQQVAIKASHTHTHTLSTS